MQGLKRTSPQKQPLKIGFSTNQDVTKRIIAKKKKNQNQKSFQTKANNETWNLTKDQTSLGSLSTPLKSKSAIKHQSRII